MQFGPQGSPAKSGRQAGTSAAGQRADVSCRARTQSTFALRQFVEQIDDARAGEGEGARPAPARTHPQQAADDGSAPGGPPCARNGTAQQAATHPSEGGEHEAPRGSPRIACAFGSVGITWCTACGRPPRRGAENATRLPPYEALESQRPLASTRCSPLLRASGVSRAGSARRCADRCERHHGERFRA